MHPPVPSIRFRFCKASEYEKISRLAHEHFGLDLRGGKQGLVAARLGKKLRELGLKSFQHYYDYVKADRSGAALAGMVDLLTTNHTSFFREPRHFDFLRKTVFPALAHASPYPHLERSLLQRRGAILDRDVALEEIAECEAAGKVRIKATDISTRMLEKAQAGRLPGRACRRDPSRSAATLPAESDRASPAESFAFTQ